MKQSNPTKRSRKASPGRKGGVSTPSHEKRYEVIRLGVDTHGGQYTFARMDSADRTKSRLFALEKKNALKFHVAG